MLSNKNIIKTLIYISNPYTSAVVEGQVYKLLQHYFSLKIFNEIILIQISNSKKNLAYLKSKHENLNFKIIHINGKISFLSSFNPLINNICEIIKPYIESKSYVLHCRTELVGYYAVKSLKRLNARLNVIVDIRGTTLEEYKYSTSDIFIIRIIRLMLLKNPLKLINNNNEVVVSVVSQSLKNYISKYISNRIIVNPSISDIIFKFDIKKRSEIRKRLKIGNRFAIVIASSGSEIWQKDQDIIDCFINNENYFIMNLSRKHINGNNVYNSFLSHDEMPFYLSAADIGIIWRDHHILNKCASPTKFSEFASMGLYIITNNSVDLIDDFIKTTNYGISINSIKDFDSIFLSKIKNEDRVKTSQLGHNLFSVNKIAQNYISNYKKILNSSQ